MKFYNIKEKPIEISGLLEGNIRLPTEIAEQCNEAVIRHYRDCAGGKIRFATDSEHVYIKVDLLHNDNIRCILASSVDFYFDGVFSGIVNPSFSLWIDAEAATDRNYRWQSAFVTVSWRPSGR